MVGYPNTGKSSIINTLRKKKVCNVAPIAGETKVWQYITLMKRIYMIDCPGIVPPNQSDTDESLLLKGCIRVENTEYPAQYVEALMKRVQPRHLQRTYEIKVDENTDPITFLEALARKGGRLLKGGEPDMDGCAKMVINDWIRGKIPWFTPPPMKDGGDSGLVKGVEGRDGRLGEMSKKRKRDDETSTTNSVAALAEVSTSDAEEEEDDEFAGFSEEEGGLELDVEDDSEDEVSGNESDVEGEVAAISEALASAKKKG
jgi:nuclear GTP-binding protein